MNTPHRRPATSSVRQTCYDSGWVEVGRLCRVLIHAPAVSVAPTFSTPRVAPASVAGTRHYAGAAEGRISEGSGPVQAGHDGRGRCPTSPCGDVAASAHGWLDIGAARSRRSGAGDTSRNIDPRRYNETEPTPRGIGGHIPGAPGSLHLACLGARRFAPSLRRRAAFTRRLVGGADLLSRRRKNTGFATHRDCLSYGACPALVVVTGSQ